jgi:hypothetical protein
MELISASLWKPISNHGCRLCVEVRLCVETNYWNRLLYTGRIIKAAASEEIMLWSDSKSNRESGASGRQRKICCGAYLKSRKETQTRTAQVRSLLAANSFSQRAPSHFHFQLPRLPV